MLAEGKELPDDIMSMVVKEAGILLQAFIAACMSFPLRL